MYPPHLTVKPQFLDQVMTWYDGQGATYYKVFNSGRSNRDTPVTICPEQVESKEQAAVQLEGMLTSLFRYPGVFVIKTWQSPKMTGAPASEMKFEVSRKDVNLLVGGGPMVRGGMYGGAPVYPNSQLPPNYYNGAAIGSTGGTHWMEKFYEAQLNYQRQIHEMKMERMEEVLEEVAESNKKLWERGVELLMNPDIAANIGGIIQGFLGGRTQVSVTGLAGQQVGQQTTFNQNNMAQMQGTNTGFTQEEQANILNAATQIKIKLPGKNVVELLQVLAAQPESTLQLLASQVGGEQQ